MSVQPLFTPVRMGELDLPNGTAHPHARWADRSRANRVAGRILCPAGFGRTDRRGSDRDQSPNQSCGKVEDNHPDRAAYLGQGWTGYAALTRGLAVHPRDAVFVSSGGELPRNFVDGPIIWKGI